MKPIAIFRHSPIEGPGYFAEFLDQHKLPWQLICIDAGEAVPVSADAFSGLVFMGGPMSVNDPLPWIEQELELIRNAVDKDIPVLGHCLGGQLMSKALGGSVRKNATKEIGWGEVSTTANAEARNWFGDIKSVMVFHWHGETFSLPNGATHLLTSKHCNNQAFSMGKHLAMQFHVEMTEEMVRTWCEAGAEEVSENLKNPGVQSVTAIQAFISQYQPAMWALAGDIYSRWIQGLSR